MKRWCIWCEGGESNPSGWFWIHTNCANKLMDIHSDVQSIKKILEGIHARNKKDEDRLKTVYDFIKDMKDFKRRWEGTMKIIRTLQKGGRGVRIRQIIRTRK